MNDIDVESSNWIPDIGHPHDHASIVLCTITKNRFCHVRPPTWLRQELQSAKRLCMGGTDSEHQR